MAFSLNVNAPALAALQNLSNTNRDLALTQERITTGLEVNSASDNAAVFSIAQQLRAELRGLSAVTQSLDRGISTTDVALAAGEAIADLLLELNERAVAAADAGLDTVSRAALNEDFTSLRSQIGSIVNNAEFNGTNLIDSGVDNVQAITSADATQTLTIDHQDLTLTSTLDALGTISAAFIDNNPATTIPAPDDVTNGPILLLTDDDSLIADNRTTPFNGGATGNIGTSQEQAAVASNVVERIQQSIINLNSALTELGAGATALQQSNIFNDQLSDVIEIGIGNLVDADLAEESANLQALQVQQQLGIQALSIANQSPQTILSLFNG